MEVLMKVLFDFFESKELAERTDQSLREYFAERLGTDDITVVLKKCPFCGGEAKLNYAEWDYNYWGVSCTHCGAYVCDPNDDTGEKTIKLWNTRVQNGGRQL